MYTIRLKCITHKRMKKKTANLVEIHFITLSSFLVCILYWYFLYQLSRLLSYGIIVIKITRRLNEKTFILNVHDKYSEWRMYPMYIYPRDGSFVILYRNNNYVHITLSQWSLEIIRVELNVILCRYFVIATCILW